MPIYTVEPGTDTYWILTRPGYWDQAGQGTQGGSRPGTMYLNLEYVERACRAFQAMSGLCVLEGGWASGHQFALVALSFSL